MDKYIKKFMKIHKTFRVRITHNTVVQIVMFATMLGNRNRIEEAKNMLYTLLEWTKNVVDFEVTKGEIYTRIGCLWLEENPQKARENLEEARRLYLMRLPGDDKRIKELDGIMKGMALKSVKSETQVLRGGQ